MTQWNEKQIIEDLSELIGVLEIKVVPSDTPVYTNTLELTLGGAIGKVYTWYRYDMNSVYITNGCQPSLSTKDMRLARLFIEVRQYFLNRDFEVTL